MLFFLQTVPFRTIQPGGGIHEESVLFELLVVIFDVDVIGLPSGL